MLHIILELSRLLGMLRACDNTTLQVVSPYSAEDAKGLLKACIRDPNPGNHTLVRVRDYTQITGIKHLLPGLSIIIGAPINIIIIMLSYYLT